MTKEEFWTEFEKLSSAFSCLKPQDKAKAYYPFFHKIDQSVFASVVDKAIRTQKSFPTVASLIEAHQSIVQFESHKEYCNVCINGSGFVSFMNTSFRANCVHGDKLSRSIAEWRGEEFAKALITKKDEEVYVKQ